eukprot:GHVS01008523.1.p1 GENE.GHVS01008523.1~~GHVS01008523.1.p1  ORF type:complete len:939 (-),score=253.70 GHVS01008523.1:473-3289(-)
MAALLATWGVDEEVLHVETSDDLAVGSPESDSSLYSSFASSPSSSPPKHGHLSHVNGAALLESTSNFLTNFTSGNTFSHSSTSTPSIPPTPQESPSDVSDIIQNDDIIVDGSPPPPACPPSSCYFHSLPPASPPPGELLSSTPRNQQSCPTMMGCSTTAPPPLPCDYYFPRHIDKLIIGSRKKPKEEGSRKAETNTSPGADLPQDSSAGRNLLPADDSSDCFGLTNDSNSAVVSLFTRSRWRMGESVQYVNCESSGSSTVRHMLAAMEEDEEEEEEPPNAVSSSIQTDYQRFLRLVTTRMERRHASTAELLNKLGGPQEGAAKVVAAGSELTRWRQPLAVGAATAATTPVPSCSRRVHHHLPPPAAETTAATSSSLAVVAAGIAVSSRPPAGVWCGEGSFFALYDAEPTSSVSSSLCWEGAKQFEAEEEGAAEERRDGNTREKSPGRSGWPIGQKRVSGGAKSSDEVEVGTEVSLNGGSCITASVGDSTVVGSTTTTTGCGNALACRKATTRGGRLSSRHYGEDASLFVESAAASLLCEEAPSPVVLDPVSRSAGRTKVRATRKYGQRGMTLRGRETSECLEPTRQRKRRHGSRSLSVNCCVDEQPLLASEDEAPLVWSCSTRDGRGGDCGGGGVLFSGEPFNKATLFSNRVLPTVSMLTKMPPLGAIKEEPQNTPTTSAMMEAACQHTSGSVASRESSSSSNGMSSNYASKQHSEVGFPMEYLGNEEGLFGDANVALSLARQQNAPKVRFARSVHKGSSSSSRGRSGVKGGESAEMGWGGGRVEEQPPSSSPQGATTPNEAAGRRPHSAKLVCRLGDKGRAALKSRISQCLRQCSPETKAKAEKISGVRFATTSQLYELAKLCNLDEFFEKVDDASLVFKMPPTRPKNHNGETMPTDLLPRHNSTKREQPTAQKLSQPTPHLPSPTTDHQLPWPLPP